MSPLANRGQHRDALGNHREEFLSLPASARGAVPGAVGGKSDWDYS